MMLSATLKLKNNHKDVFVSTQIISKKRLLSADEDIWMWSKAPSQSSKIFFPHLNAFK